MLSAVVNPFISKDMEWFGCAVMLMGCALTTSNPTTIARKKIFIFQSNNMEDLPFKVFPPFFYPKNFLYE